MRKIVIILSLICFSVVAFAQVQKTVETKVAKTVKPISIAEAEVKPVYPGGDVALMEFIVENTKYPAKAKENKSQGKVFVKFVIDEKGKVSNAEIVSKDTDPLLSDEALRIINSMKDWTPAQLDGKNVAVEYIIPINFKLDDKEQQIEKIKK
ncbi:MAG: energy transducer TonB [Bacteroidales bacterium]|jgi:TonB family protein|nr:energy transducer TonB [Bacteroidales bacterium]MCK9498692.1 energy transducer TonB [Bacteroidales bacterium]MDY0314023.1 energy transducer TonB [Bacteroidales bacterium]NLB86527.1 energy transducer TonB [Bacteroidales bacterium]